MVFALLFILFIGLKSCLAWMDLAGVLENQRIDDQFRLLNPEALLKNRRPLHKEVNNIINGACDRDLVLYERAVEQRESWALKMLDASSKVPSGILEGHLIDMGMFDECVEVRKQLVDVEIRGRHCMYGFNPTLKTPFFINPALSICLPATCTAEDVTVLLRNTINATGSLNDLGINAASVTCNDLPLEHTNSSLTIFLIIAAVYTMFLVFCTICEIANRRENNSFNMSKNLERFSLLKNAEGIFNTKVRDSELTVIHGIRAITCCWIVLGHEFASSLLGVHVNLIGMMKWIFSWNCMFVIMALFSVDTFFALNGFLRALYFFKGIRKTKKFNYLQYILHRYIRSTPTVGLIIVLTLMIAPDIGSGARCDWLKHYFIKGCTSNWWAVLSYSQIFFFEMDNFCLTHLWTLSVDMQLYCLAPCILYPLYKRPKLGLTILISLIFGSTIVSGYLVGTNNYSAFMLPEDFNITLFKEVFQKVYVMPHTRACPWLIGILFAYAVVHKGTTPNKVLMSTGWILAIASFAYCIFGTRTLAHIDYEYSWMQEVTFATLQRPLWAFGICWIIYASVHQAAGPLSSLLSSKIFLPISRLSYSIYLVHVILPARENRLLRTPKYFNPYITLHSFISNMLLSILLGLIFNITVERPFLILEDIFIKKNQLVHEETQKTK